MHYYVLVATETFDDDFQEVTEKMAPYGEQKDVSEEKYTKEEIVSLLKYMKNYFLQLEKLYNDQKEFKKFMKNHSWLTANFFYSHQVGGKPFLKFTSDEWIQYGLDEEFIVKEGEFYKPMCNLRGQWDYWTIGGRWQGRLSLNEEALRKRVRKDINYLSQIQKNVDFAQKWEINLENKKRILPAAFVDLEGVWHSQPEFIEKDIEAYEEQFWDFFDSLDDNIYLNVVDIHV